MSIVNGSINFGPNIVRDGLILHVDAANSKSYPGSGTNWKDLSGNDNDVTLTNPTFNQNDNLGSITGFNVAISLNEISIGDEHTVTLFGKNLYIASSNSIELFQYNSNNNKFKYETKYTDPAEISEFDYPQNDIMSFTYTVSDTKTILYLNGNKLDEITYSNINNFNPNYGFGSLQTNTNIFKIYNRVLTENEVQQNFNALKGRFGL